MQSIEGFKWEDSDDAKPVTIKKRSVIGNLGDTLIIQCNRFVFDFDTFTQKIEHALRVSTLLGHGAVLKGGIGSARR